jgi:hypothetical protein
MKNGIRTIFLALVASTVLGANNDCNLAVWARGGGGGFRGAGGSFEGGGYRGGEVGGYHSIEPEGGGVRGEYGRSEAVGLQRGADNFARANENFERPTGFASTPRPSEGQLRSAANTSYNWGSAPARSLSTDAGFGHFAATGAGSHQTTRVAPAALTSYGGNVRAGYRNTYGTAGFFNHRWWGAHPGYWNRYMADNWAWAPGCYNWGGWAGWWGMPANVDPTYYDYGDNIYYQGNDVYYGSQPVEQAETYYDQAQYLADSDPAAYPATAQETQKDWKSLGVYSLVQGTQTNTTSMFQLATNRKGAIKGTYYNALTQETKPVQGAVDKKSMRAAWIIGNDKNVVYDTGVANLLKQQSPVLVHLGRDKTEQWTLVRLQEPN